MAVSGGLLAVVVAAFAACGALLGIDSASYVQPDAGASDAPGFTNDSDAGASDAPPGFPNDCGATGARDAGLVVVACEGARTVAVAVYKTGIYWWSTRDEVLRHAEKGDHTVTTVVARPDQNVTAIAVDESGVYWVETGPSHDAGASRVMKFAGGTASVLLPSSDSLKRLALGSADAVTISAAGLVLVPKEASDAGAYLPGGSFTENGLASDGAFTFFYTYDVGIFSVSRSRNFRVIGGLEGQHDVVADGNSLFWIGGTSPGNTLFKCSTSSGNLLADAAVPLATGEQGPTVLALDGTDVFWASASAGTIRRVAKIGGSPSSIATEAGAPNAIAADRDGVYWTNDDGTVTWAPRR